MPSRLRPTLSWPTLERLARAGRKEDAAALVRYRDLFAPPANDNSLPSGDVTPTHEESELEVRPSVFELLAAASRSTVVTGPLLNHTGSGLRFDLTRHLTSWQDVDGRWHRPRESSRSKSRTSRRRSDENIRRYLALPGVPRVSSERRAQSEGRASDKRPLSKMLLAAELESFGVDGGVPFKTARLNAGLPSAERCPSAVAQGAIFFGGVSAPGSRNVPPAISSPELPNDFLEQRRLARALGPTHVMALEHAISSCTAKELGEYFGYSRKYAERVGVRMIDGALEAFRRLAS